MDKLIEWLLEGDPWVVYRTRLDLLNQPETTPDVIKSRNELINHPKIKTILKEVQNWPGTVLSSHKSANQTYHKLSFLADIGMNKNDAPIKQVIQKIFEHQSKEGPFQLPMNIPQHFGGSGKDEWAWALCDAPVILYSLIKFGLGEDAKIKSAVKYLTNLVSDNGWHCIVSKELGKFRGPGRKDDPCPYATFVMLKMLVLLNEYKRSKETLLGANCLLDLWENSKKLHPYMFYMGTDFRKIKAPYIWYDLLHVLDLLTQIDSIKKDKRLIEMTETLKSKSDKEGKFTPESEYKAWKDWDFGQKKCPSRWVTFLSLRILKRFKV
ncbi:MAG: hypothetical protein PHX21_11320 [bacterium]|nr:hypothetical protein [bacterium]